MKCVCHVAQKKKVCPMQILLTHNIHNNALFRVELHHLLTLLLLNRMNTKSTEKSMCLSNIRHQSQRTKHVGYNTSRKNSNTGGLLL
jgi:hypothetical protein